MNDEKAVAVREYVLERLAWATQVPVSPALEQHTTVERFQDIVGERLVYMLRTAIYAQRLDQQVVRYPADWWQAFKRRFFPAWALRRWPVLETVQTMRLFAWYPDKMIPGERSQYVIQVLPGEVA